MHVGGLTILEGPAPAMEDFLEQIRRRLHLVPRYRHKLAYTALDAGRPVWVDDPTFNLEFHVRHTALPSPGSWEQLRNLTARIFSQALDRSRPLWEMWLIEGSRGRPLRAHLQDPPFADRRHRGGRSRDGAVRRLPRPGAAAPLGPGRGNPIPSRTRPSLSAPVCAGRCAQGSRWRAPRSARSPTPSARLSARARPPRASGRSCGPGSIPRRGRR